MGEHKKQRCHKSLSKGSVGGLVQPYFVVEGTHQTQPIASMPGVSRFSIDELVKEVAGVQKLGIKAILLFAVLSPLKKDSHGSGAYAQDNLVSRAVTAIKKKIKGVAVITDVCLCAYTTHGHCGILKSHRTKALCDSKIIDNKRTCAALAEMALRHAEAGADWVAPSAMASGQVASIRRKLDAHGFYKVKILGYSAKFASVFYGPFREAAKSAPAFGDRRGYQIDPIDDERAMREIAEDIAQGADMVMVKPALAYLDIIRRAKEKFKVLVAAYHVSGEYAMIKMGVHKGYWDEQTAVIEVVTAIRRAGADVVISYHAQDIARWAGQKKARNGCVEKTERIFSCA